MNWEFDDALATADKRSFFKFMVKSIAEKHGLRATFMPKPFKGLTGNGCHCHISVWDLDGHSNAFADDNATFGLSNKGRHFLGGIIKHASALAAITNPSVNSYKRINAPRAYESDETLKTAMGAEFSAAYLKLKHQEWDSFCAQFTPWEHATTLDI